MNIVDINYVINKYIDNLIVRHSTYVTHMASILTFDGKYINKNTSHIVKKYNKLLDIKKLSIITKCITNNIRVKIMFYKMNINDIDLIVTTSFDCGNKHYLKYINDNVNIINVVGNMDPEGYMRNLLYKYDVNINSVMFYVKSLRFIDNKNDDDYDDDDYYDDYYDDDNSKHILIKFLCANGYLSVIKNLYKNNVLTIQDFQLCDENLCIFGTVYETTCKNGHVGVIKYLHKKIGLEKLKSCNLLYVFDHFDIIKYFHQEIGLTKEDFRKYDNYACKLACSRGHVKIVKYLHQEIGLTTDNFQSYNNKAYIDAWYNGHYNVVNYFNEEIISQNIFYKKIMKYTCWLMKYSHWFTKIYVSYRFASSPKHHLMTLGYWTILIFMEFMCFFVSLAHQRVIW